MWRYHYVEEYVFFFPNWNSFHRKILVVVQELSWRKTEHSPETKAHRRRQLEPTQDDLQKHDIRIRSTTKQRKAINNYTRKLNNRLSRFKTLANARERGLSLHTKDCHPITSTSRTQYTTTYRCSTSPSHDNVQEPQDFRTRQERPLHGPHHLRIQMRRTHKRPLTLNRSPAKTTRNRSLAHRNSPEPLTHGKRNEEKHSLYPAPLETQTAKTIVNPKNRDIENQA